MATKIRTILILPIILTFAGLIVTYFQAGRLADLFLAVPRIMGTSSPVGSVEAANNRGMLFTYENRSLTTVSAINSTHNVVLVGTNHNLPFVMNHSLIHGRFFREYAVRYSHQVAVLNEAAAFALFGSSEATGNEVIMRGSPYIILGVINDGDSENLNMYVPASLGDSTKAVAANLASNLSDIGVLNEWQRMGISGSHYRFVDFSILRTVIQDRTILAATLAAIFILLLILSKIVASMKMQFSTLQRLRREVYMTTMLAKSPTWKVLGLGIAFIATTLGCALLAMDAFMRILIAHDTRGMLDNVQSAAFSAQLEGIARLSNQSSLLLLGFVVFLVMYTLFSRTWLYTTKKGIS